MLLEDTLGSIRSRWSRLVEPPDTLEDPFARHRYRVLSSLLLVFSPVAFVMAALDFFLDDNPPLTEDISFLVAVAASVFLLIIYWLNRRGYHTLSTWFVIVCGSGFIALNAYGADVPDNELSLFALIPLFVYILVPIQQALIIYLLYLGVAYGMVQLLLPVDGDNVTDFMLFLVIVEIMALFAAYQRDLLEKERSKDLNEKETRSRMLLEQQPCITWTLDHAFKVDSIRGNRALSEDRVADFAQSLAEAGQGEVLQSVLGGQSLTFETVWANVPYQHTVEPLCDLSGAIIGCIGVTLDISDRKQQEIQQLEFARQQERNKVVVEFLRNFSHDFKTPLSTINTSLHLLRRSNSPEKREERIVRIENSVQHLDMLISSMLSLSRLDLLPSENREPVSLNSLVEQLLHKHQPIATDKGVTIQAVLDVSLPHMATLREEMLDALDRIFVNALQSTTAGDTIAIRTTQDDVNAILEITDTGPGIPEADLPYVFDRFYRVQKHRPLDEMQVGLGLSIAKKVIDLHQGTLAITSPPNQGCTVTVSLPLSPTAD